MTAIIVISMSLPANAVFVDTLEDELSKSMGASYDYVGACAGFNAANDRYRAGSCVVIRNGSVSWALSTEHQLVDEDTGERFVAIQAAFRDNMIVGFDSGAGMDVVEIFENGSRDVVLLKFSGPITNESAELITPAPFYMGEVEAGMQFAFFGFGNHGPPSEASASGSSGSFDGFVRMGLGDFFSAGLAGEQPEIVYTEFIDSVELSASGGKGDSGGPVFINVSGELQLVGILDQVVGSGTSALTGFENFRFDDEFIEWVNDTIISNSGSLDSDGDGIPDSVEGTEDLDNDGTPNYLDTDADGDGMDDIDEVTGDPDSDGIPNFLDDDSDGDGEPDGREARLGSDPYDAMSKPDPLDINGDGAINAIDVQLVINDVLNLAVPPFLTGDTNRDGAVNAADIQQTINAALGIAP